MIKAMKDARKPDKKAKLKRLSERAKDLSDIEYEAALDRAEKRVREIIAYQLLIDFKPERFDS